MRDTNAEKFDKDLFEKVDEEVKKRQRNLQKRTRDIGNIEKNDNSRSFLVEVYNSNEEVEIGRPAVARRYSHGGFIDFPVMCYD
jgi:hypothetical protein